MLTITPTQDFAQLLLPLPFYASEKIADAVNENGEKFSLYTGLSEDLADQLKQYSLDLTDTVLHRGTSDHKRFGIGDYATRYREKPRQMFALVHDATGAMSSLIWYGPKPIPPGVILDRYYDVEKSLWDTSAYRAYGAFRGKGIMGDFSRYVLSLYKEKNVSRNMWISVKRGNESAVGLYESLGFVIIGDDNEEKSYIMALNTIDKVV